MYESEIIRDHLGFVCLFVCLFVCFLMFSFLLMFFLLPGKSVEVEMRTQDEPTER